MRSLDDIKGNGMNRRLARQYYWAVQSTVVCSKGLRSAAMANKNVSRSNLFMYTAISPGHIAVVGVCLDMMPSRGGDYTRTQEVDHG